MNNIVNFHKTDDYEEIINFIKSLLEQNRLKGISFALLLRENDETEAQAGWVKSRGVTVFELMGSVQCLQQRLYEEIQE